MSITSMLQKRLGVNLITEQGKLAKVGDRVATEVMCRCEIQAGMSDGEIVNQLTKGAKKLCKGRVVSLRPVDVHDIDGGRKLALAYVGFI